MGIYLGQLPPAEIARLKAELAETLIANFCYPRFFDNRVEALRMRPVDRAKRQEVWLFLSSVDFTSWSRIDLTTPDLQHQVERLFIQFVQRNRAFFGQQGRKRMPDVRLLINSSASSVIEPIGTCHGLNSPNSPRMVTSTKQGKPQFFSSENMLMQLPTPLDCINSVARWPPSAAPATRPTPSSSVVSTTSVISGSAWQSAIKRLCPASGT
jgi:hypothetical protein